MSQYYPVMLDVRGRRAVVVGGDRVAVEKASHLLASGALVTAISPTFCAAFRTLAQHAGTPLTLVCKEYAGTDIDGAFLVVLAATSDPALVDRVWDDTQRARALVNVVDVPDRCSYIIPSILRRGHLTIAVSTEGASPSLAKRIRQRLEALFPSAYGPYLGLARVARQHLRHGGIPYDQRDAFFGDYESSPVLDHLSAGDNAAACETISQLLGRHGIAVPAEQILREHEARQ